MARTTARTLLLLAVAVASVGVAGVWWAGRLAPESRSTVEKAPWLDFVPSPAQEQKMAQLRAGLRPGVARFPNEEHRLRENAELFTYMAGTSDDDLVVRASLEALRAAYGARSTKKPLPDRDVERVLTKNLASPSPARVTAALETARVPLMMEQPNEDIARNVADLARADATSAAHRLLALQVLDVQRDDQRSPSTLATFVEALGQEPAAAVAGLLGLSHSRRSLATKGPLDAEARTKARELTSAADPGVRGTALTFLATAGPDAQAAVLARRLLADPHPYVRSVAASRLGKIGAPSDIHELMKLIEDMGESRMKLTGPTGSDGTSSDLVLVVPPHRSVAEAALSSIRSLGEQRLLAVDPATSPEELRRRLPALTFAGPGTGPAEVAESAAHVRLWYAREQARLPQPP